MQKTNVKKQSTKVALHEVSFINSELTQIGRLKKELNTNETQLKFIKQMTNKDLTDVDLLLFLSFANKVRLNPFTGEIIAVVYQKDDPDKRKVTYIATRDGKRVVAGRTGQLEGISSEAIYAKAGKAVQGFEDGAVLWGAKATVKRNGGEFVTSVRFSEYNTGKNVWVGKPETMIRKVAESQALSSAFPEVLSGIYDESEVGYLNGTDKKQLAVPNGEESATKQQIDSLKAMGFKAKDLKDLTRSKAVEMLTSKVKVVKEVVEETNEQK